MYSNMLALTFLQSLAASNEVKTSRKYYALRAVTPPQLHYDPNRWDLRPGERELEQMGERKYGNLLQQDHPTSCTRLETIFIKREYQMECQCMLVIVVRLGCALVPVLQSASQSVKDTIGVNKTEIKDNRHLIVDQAMDPSIRPEAALIKTRFLLVHSTIPETICSSTSGTSRP